LRTSEVLTEKVAIVTGASRGIGRATALEMARNGTTTLLAARTVEACKPIVASIRSEGGKAEAAACDVSRYADVQRLVDRAFERYGRIDVLVNNAGVIEPIDLLESCDPDSWTQNIMVNLIGVFHGCRAVLPRFRQANQGIIINVSSGAAHRALEGWSAYCAGKAGVAMLTEAVALEAGDAGVRVYGFQPGVVDTRMQEAIRDSGRSEISELPREELTDPSEPARMIAWLCTDEAADLSGEEVSLRDQELRRRVGLRS
jgi:3-oxoacyl-[acyl-carrier protein] reductase